MLFLHGYLSSKEAFTAQIRYFSKFFKVTAIDFVGFGQSAPLTQPFSVNDYAEWLYGVIEALGLQNPHIVAHSFGCRVAVKLAKGRGQGLGKLVLTGAAGVRLKKGLGYHGKVAAYKICKKIAPNFAEKHFGSKEYRTLSPVMKESYKKIVNEDLREDAAQIKNDVLIIQGKEDETTPMKEARAYLAAFPKAKLKVMEGGHFAFVQHPLPFNLAVEEFLQDDGTTVKNHSGARL